MSVSADWKYVTGMVKGGHAGASHWTIKEGSARSGALSTLFNGPRPSITCGPMRREGAIILGTAGDNSNAAQGNFFEGVMTAQYSSDDAVDAVQNRMVSTYGP